MKSLQVRLIYVLGIVAIAGIAVVQGYWLKKAFDSEARQFDQSVFIALNNVALELANTGEANTGSRTPVNQVSNNYYVVNVNGEIDANLLEMLLTNEFKRLNLLTSYEYGIYDCATDKVVYGNLVNLGAKNTRGSGELPKYTGLNYYFSVLFPGRDSIIAGSMKIWIFTSIVLLLVCVFLLYALWIIFRQRRLSRSQREFVNSMAHELKTPISTIAIASDYLSSPTREEAKKQQYLRVMKEESQRLSLLTDNVLQVIRSEKKAYAPTKTEFDLHECITKTVETFSAVTPQANIRLNLEATRSLILADEVHIRNIIHNLLDNAVKYTTLKPEITIETANSGNDICLSVSDNGEGIKEKELRRVFDRFYRSPAHSQVKKGFGLGLTYVRNIVEAHGGSIKAYSKRGLGSTFTIKLKHA